LKKTLWIVTAILGLATFSLAGVSVSLPTINSTNTAPVHFVASATGNHPIVAMMIYSDNNGVYSVNASSLDTNVQLATGSHYIVVQAWDTLGVVYKASGFNIQVNGGTNPTYTMIQAMSGWQSCGSCAGRNGQGPDTPRSMTQFISTPSMTGQSSEYWIGPNQPWSNALWWKQLGANPNATHFIYDLYFYMTDPGSPQAVEFDMNQSANGHKFIFGTECDVKGTHGWDVWDTANGTWVHTGISCSAIPAYTWNHLVLEFQRSGNQTSFISVTLNGSKSYINRTFNTFAVNAAELNTAVQIDGDGQDHQVKLWVDQMQVTAW
jgi:hypothetical protein